MIGKAELQAERHRCQSRISRRAPDGIGPPNSVYFLPTNQGGSVGTCIYPTGLSGCGTVAEVTVASAEKVLANFAAPPAGHTNGVTVPVGAVTGPVEIKTPAGITTSSISLAIM